MRAPDIRWEQAGVEAAAIATARTTLATAPRPVRSPLL